MRCFHPELPLKFHHPAPFYRADSDQVTTPYHSVSLGNLPVPPGRTAMREGGRLEETALLLCRGNLAARREGIGTRPTPEGQGGMETGRDAHLRQGILSEYRVEHGLGDRDGWRDGWFP